MKSLASVVEISFLLLVSLLLRFSGAHKNFKDYLLCQKCGRDLAPVNRITNIPSPLAVYTHNNASIFGIHDVLLQSLELNERYSIKVIAVSKTFGRAVGTWQTINSWYPGYLYKSIVCTRCNTKIGWLFEPIRSTNLDRLYASRNGFYVLKVSSLVNEEFSDSLIQKII